MQRKNTNKDKEVYVILHNVRSAHNVGSIFRTADAAGVSKLYLTGYTPTPVDRFGRARKDIAKAALGAEKTVPWEEIRRIGPLLKKLKSEGVCIVGLEQDRRAKDYRTIQRARKTALILGNEVTGLSESILHTCDEIAEIPMRGKLARNRLPDDGGKESLNVSVAAGIALFRMTELPFLKSPVIQ